MILDTYHILIIFLGISMFNIPVLFHTNLIQSERIVRDEFCHSCTKFGLYFVQQEHTVKDEFCQSCTKFGESELKMEL